MLTIYKPKPEDLWFREQLLSDEQTMSYNHAWGGTIPFPRSEWQKYYDDWIADNEGKRFYAYLANDRGEWVGEIAYHLDSETDCYLSDIIILSRFRGCGYGSLGLELLCSVAKENGISVLYDDMAIDNPALSLFKEHGFTESFRTDRIIMLKKIL